MKHCVFCGSDCNCQECYWCDADELVRRVQRLREFAELVRDCPDSALHLMPLAAQAALAGERSTESPPKEET